MARAPKTPTEAPEATEAPERPAWFDPSQHFISSFGIHEIASGALLDEDGQPQSAALRAALERAADAEEAANNEPPAGGDQE